VKLPQIQIPTMIQPADADDISVFAAECGGYYDSAADGLASNFGALPESDGSPIGLVSVAASLSALAGRIARAMPWAAAQRRAALSARFAGVIAIDRDTL
jgi:hypothetical protein